MNYGLRCSEIVRASWRGVWGFRESDMAGADEIYLTTNRQASPRAGFGAEERVGYDPDLAAAARDRLARWPDYRPTRLLDLPGLAARAGVARVYAKYEGERTELASFKALGGAYALSVVLGKELERRGAGRNIGFEDLQSGRFAREAGEVTAVCASDGNHGRSLAWGAARFGCRCIVYLPTAVSDFRARAIARYGAEVVRVQGNYDDAVRAAAVDAARNAWLVISDTATPTYQEIPRLVTAGYSLMVQEALDALESDERPTHVFVQVGCGGLAAVVAGHLWHVLGRHRPTIIGVEPSNAACLLATVEQGELAIVGGDHATVMGGLACGEVSWTAWPVLRRGIDHVMAMPDDLAIEAVRLLHDGRLGAQADAGESGAAGVGALLGLAARPELRAKVGLGPTSRVLLFITEGVTDPEQFAAITRTATLASAPGPHLPLRQR